MKEEIAKFFKSAGTLWIVVLLAAVTVLGVWLAASDEKQNNISPPAQASVDLDAFRRDCEQGLKTIISAIDGVGEVEVMITVEGTPAKVYAEDVQSGYDSDGESYSGSSQSQTVFSEDTGRNKTPVLLYEQMPGIRGVAVVCKGEIDAALSLKITQLVSSLFGIRTNKVCVIY